MARPRGDGVKIVRKKLRDGRVVEYRYQRPQAEVQRPAPTVMSDLVADYLGSPEFRHLAHGTKKQYRRYLEQIRGQWGSVPIGSVRQSDVLRIRDAHQDQPAVANMWLAVLGVLFQFGMRRDLCTTNPAAKGGRLPPPKRDQIWNREDERRALEAFRPSLRLAYLLLLYTVQRPSDVLAMTKGSVSERGGRLWIALRQAKTGALVDVPVHTNLEPHLRERMADPDGGLLLVPSPTGRPWNGRNFRRAWDHDLARAEVAEHRQRRDLRRTGIVRLAEAGATTPQIAAISGHGIDRCQRIIDTYLPRRPEVALGGIEAWERSAGTDRVVRIRKDKS